MNKNQLEIMGLKNIITKTKKTMDDFNDKLNTTELERSKERQNIEIKKRGKRGYKEKF